MTPEDRREIYTAYKLGEPLLTLAVKYKVTESRIRKIVKRYRYDNRRNLYWLNSPNQYYADTALNSYLTISRKYNTPSGRRIND